MSYFQCQIRAIIGEILGIGLPHVRVKELHEVGDSHTEYFCLVFEISKILAPNEAQFENFSH